MESQASFKRMFSSFPQTGPIPIQQGSMAIPVQPYRWKEYLQKFLRGEPKALGTVQIMIALMNLSLGMIIISLPENSYGQRFFLWYTGYVYWGSGFFITSGALSIAAENRTTNSLVQSSLAMNIISSVMAGIGIILLSINLTTFGFHFYVCRQGNSLDSCDFLESILVGINIFLLILNILELAISNTISGFGCKAICCVQGAVTIFMPPPAYVPENSADGANKGGPTLQSSAADTTAFSGSHPDSFI